SPANDEPAVPAETFPVKEVRNVAYGADPGDHSTWHQLDLYVPKGKKGYPVLLFVHGGSWKFGDKNCFGWGRALGTSFARHGVGVVMPSCRLAPAVKTPEQAKEVARAIAWTHDHVGT